MSLLDDMAADIAGDHVFYDADSGFGIDAVPEAGGTLRLIFDNEYVEFESGGAAVVGSAPRAWCRTSEVLAIGDKLTIGTQDYVIRNAEPNADGETYLTLHESTIAT